MYMHQVVINTPKKTIKTTVYDNLAGVDFSQPAANVDNKRSPDCVNMISDNGKNPVKRAGWQTQVRFAETVHNVWFFNLHGTEHCLAQVGTTLHKIIEENGRYTALQMLYYPLADKKGCGFYFREGDEDGFYILTGSEYLRYDGTMVKKVAEDAYIPVTIIARKPTGGGESYEYINLLTGYMEERFTGDDTAKVYQLSHSEVQSIDKVQSLQEDGSLKELVKDTDYTVNTALGQVTFTKAYPTPIEGHDNIHITYCKEFEGYADKIKKCTAYCTYGVGGNNRVFLTCNPDYPAYDFWSDVWKPSYFPDLNYAIVGNTDSSIKGYLKISDNVAIVKEQNGQDTTIFLRSGSMNDDGSVNFFVRQGIVGIGAVSQNGFAVLNDDPLFLSKQGIYAVSPSYLTYDRVTRNRSYYIDPQLREEEGLDKAVAVVWNGCYMLGVNGKVYILDGRKKTTGGTENDYRYECWYWDNVPANCFAVDGSNRLWFGTADGRLCMFKDDSFGNKKYNDDGAAIKAVWSTPLDDDGIVQNFKTLRKKGCLVSLAPYGRSGCKVYYAVDGKQDKLVREGIADMSTFFEEIDFARFSFVSSDSPRDIYFNKKQRKYKRLQLVFISDEADEGFGIYKIVKTYEIKGYSKNRR